MDQNGKQREGNNIYSMHTVAGKNLHFQPPKPVLKWAGGKTQLLTELKSRVPNKYGRYIEPFVGGGALFFALQPSSGVIADSNPELINLYECLVNNVEQLIRCLSEFKNTEDDYYLIRKLDYSKLDKEYAAARTLYLNRTCYNGLYRVNKSGQFNVPFGRYKTTTICHPEKLRAATLALQNVDIVCGDYKAVLKGVRQSWRFHLSGSALSADIPIF